VWEPEWLTERVSGCGTKRHPEHNPVAGIARDAESTGRVIYLAAEGEGALYHALRLEHRALFLVSPNTGLRWSDRRRLTGRSRVVPMSSLVRDVMTELATARKRIGDPREAVFADGPRRPEEFFPRAVTRARAARAGAGQDPAPLDDYTWHANRHTWESRLTMAGVDPRALQPPHARPRWRSWCRRLSPLWNSHRTNIAAGLAPTTDCKSLSSKRRFASADRAQHPNGNPSCSRVASRKVLLSLVSCPCDSAGTGVESIPVVLLVLNR
jgi:hypothetical protein